MKKLRYAMVGGGQGAFIGAVHRKAMALDGQIELVAGALSSDPERARASGRELGLQGDRNHGRWEQLLEDELKRPKDERIDFVSIVTPNHMHFPVAHAFAKEGIHVVCDKPLVHSSEEAQALAKTVERSGSIFGVTYNYTGYPLVREAREMVARGAIGEVRKVIVEYNQGWLATNLEASGQKQADWRTDPARSGLAGAIGDIGSHAENLAVTVTGLELEAICADLTIFVPGRRLDDDGNVLLRFKNGAKGVLIASQIEVGCENGLCLRVFGTTGTLEWHQEEPNKLLHSPIDGPMRTLTRGSSWLGEAAKRATRLPTGHPEAFLEAFANIYLGVAAHIRAVQAGVAPDPIDADYPRLADGARGVKFIEKVVESAASKAKWTSM